MEDGADTRFPVNSHREGIALAVVMFVVAASAACGPARDDAAHDSAGTSAGNRLEGRESTPDTMKHHESDSVAGMDRDQRFLRWMLDQHAELIFLAHQALAHTDSLAVRDEAKHLDDTHDAETAELIAILRQEYRDQYRASVRPEHAAMLAPFKSLSGNAYSSAFRSFLITHHREAVRVTDSSLASLRRPRVRAVAERIKAARERDISLLERKSTRR